MSLLIQGGEVVTASARFAVDVLCEGEQITRVEPGIPPPPAATVIDARGRYVFPGFIDPHVHVHLPAMGTLAKDTYASASRAAVLGGTTCFFDFVLPGRDESPLAALETWRAKSENQSACDYSFHMAVTRFNSRVAKDLAQVVAAGIPSFKVHLAYPETLGLDDTELYGALGLARSLDVITMAHCENAALIAALQRKLLAEGKTGPEWHYHSRPPRVEADGTHHFLAIADLHRAHAYVAHLSCDEALRVALDAKRRGQPVWIETLIQFLLLDKSCAERPDFEGAKYVMSPPLRDASNHAALWNALRHGQISAVATDHAPFDFKGQKDRGRADFTRIAGGLPGIQDRVNLLFTYGVREGRIDLHGLVAAASTEPARLFGLLPRKGTIQVGSDADLVVYDPHYEGTISAATHAMNVDYSAFEGWAIRGRAEAVTVRGRLVVRNGEFIGESGHGRFLAREPTH
ncbi:MAG: dihydropyrimidinase [Kiritimatiellae bacterium]|nr:dihydropyrimidinase [Kiritimatiellia bacterium]